MQRAGQPRAAPPSASPAGVPAAGRAVLLLPKTPTTTRRRAAAAGAGGGVLGATAAAAIAPPDQLEVDGTLAQLMAPLGDAAAAARLQAEHPDLVVTSSCDLPAWREFWIDGFGLAPSELARLLLKAPRVFTRSSLYNTGRMLLLLRSLGWRDADVRARLLPSHPLVLGASVEDEALPALQELAALGADARALVWELPEALCSRGGVCAGGYTGRRARERRLQLLRSFARMGRFGLPADAFAEEEQQRGPQQQQGRRRDPLGQMLLRTWQ